MDNPLDFLAGASPEADQPRVDSSAPEPAEPPAQAAEPSPERPRDDAGRFAAKPADAAAQAPLTDAETVKIHGILNAKLDERDKRQKAEAALAEANAKLAAYEAERPQSPVDKTSAELQSLRSKYDRLEANVTHGADAVKTAYDWAFDRCEPSSANYDPVFNSRVAGMIQSMGNPYEVAVALRKEADALDALKNPPAQADPNPEPHQSTPQAPLPRSLATAPGNGAAGKPHVNVGQGEAYGSIFSKG